MSETVVHIFDSTHCLSPAQMIDYVRGKLSAEERYRVEAHLNSCSFCSEAVDGLANIQDPDGFSLALQHVHHHFKKQLREKHRFFLKSYRTQLYLVLIIIVILAILLFAFYLVHFTILRH
ncbi:anti-sigma factor family protein [Thermoflavifilum thermophilum]|uniref:Putative zinc-finger n=1 Tax=Thermoflavifilum thermophilum TaxID=1393122 RepID=A0A1I7MXG5_9BACT|nr:zf-HC2 domain-containing protein [Thermoflavifilum thermophilum]SFV27074.1 Putative zinc-finger [Thermoflavifilum thermophilum]